MLEHPYLSARRHPVLRLQSSYSPTVKRVTPRRLYRAQTYTSDLHSIGHWSLWRRRETAKESFAGTHGRRRALVRCTQSQGHMKFRSERKRYPLASHGYLKLSVSSDDSVKDNDKTSPVSVPTSSLLGMMSNGSEE